MGFRDVCFGRGGWFAIPIGGGGVWFGGGCQGCGGLCGDWGRGRQEGQQPAQPGECAEGGQEDEAEDEEAEDGEGDSEGGFVLVVGVWFVLFAHLFWIMP